MKKSLAVAAIAIASFVGIGVQSAQAIPNQPLAVVKGEVAQLAVVEVGTQIAPSVAPESIVADLAQTGVTADTSQLVVFTKDYTVAENYKGVRTADLSVIAAPKASVDQLKVDTITGTSFAVQKEVSQGAIVTATRIGAVGYSTKSEQIHGVTQGAPPIAAFVAGQGQFEGVQSFSVGNA